ncbi:Gypsy retrotransposon integrase-like protein 1, partial [Marasmius tenuissimus]
MLRILKDLPRHIIDLEEQLEAFKKREHARQIFATTTPDSSVTNKASGTPMITHYTPAYTPTYVEGENEGQVSGDETSTVNLVKAVVNQLAISTPAPAHPQTSELAQYLREPDSNSDGDLTPCGNSMGRQSAKGLSVPARLKRKEFWDIHSWQLGVGNQDTSDPLMYHGYTFPPPDLLPTLVSLFFTNVHPFFPVLHKSIFEQGVNEGLHHRDAFFAGVLLVIFPWAHSFDLPLPLPCDDEYWACEERGKTDHENSDQDFKQPADRPSRMSYWVAFLKLLDIVAFAQETLYTVRKTNVWTRMGMTEMEWNEKIVGELDSALSAWIGTVPAHLKWNPNRVHYPGYNPKESNPFFEQSTILYVTYYWAQIIVHKPFLTTTPSPVPSSAAAK